MTRRPVPGGQRVALLVQLIDDGYVLLQRLDDAVAEAGLQISAGLATEQAGQLPAS